MQLIQERNYLSLFLSRKSEESIVSKGYVLISGVTAHTLIAVIFNYRYLRGWHAILKYFSPLIPESHADVNYHERARDFIFFIYRVFYRLFFPVLEQETRCNEIQKWN